MSLDYATLARIEDHLRRIADALEGCASDRACVAASWAPVPGMPGEWQAADPANRADGEVPTPEPEPVFCPATAPGHRCARAEHADDRHQWTMTDEEYDRRREEAGVPREVFDDVRAWADGREAAQRRLTAGCGYCGGECGQLGGPGAAVGSDRHVATSTNRKACEETYADCTLCEPDIEYRCRLEDGHDGGHVWTKLADWEIELLGGVQAIEPDPLDILADIMTAIETGCDMVTHSLRPQSNAQQTVDAMRAAVAMLRETVMRYTGPAVAVDARSLETGEPVPVSVTVRKVADPLDEDDHRPRHFPDGEHLRRYACGHWHMATRDRCNDPDHGDSHTLAWWDEPLTFCDCESTVAEPPTDPLDESDHRPRHARGGGHLYRWGFEHWHSKDPVARPDWCSCDRLDDRDSLDDWVQAGFGPLTFCDCDPTDSDRATD